MRKINIKKEWDLIKHELFFNRPLKAPYPKNIVKKREFLLFAQVFLADYYKAKTKEERLKSKIAYLKAMDTYFTLK